MLRLFIHTRLLQVLKGRSWILLPTTDQNIMLYYAQACVTSGNHSKKKSYTRHKGEKFKRKRYIRKQWLPHRYIKDKLISSGNYPPNTSPFCVLCYLPELLQFVDLLCSDLACPELLLFRRDLHQPGQKTPVLDQRLPLGAVPINVLQTALTGTWLPKHTNTQPCEYTV